MGVLDFTNYILNPHALPYLVVGVVVIVLGVMTLLEDIRSSIHLTFYTLSLSVAWWLISQAIAYSATNGEIALFWYKILWVGAIFIAPAAYTFTITVLGVPKTKEQIILAYFTFIPFLFTIPGDLFITSAVKHSWAYLPQSGPLQLVFLGFFTFYLTFCLFHQARVAFNKNLSGITRSKAKVLLVSFLVAFFAALDFLPVFGISFYPIGFIPLFLWLIITAYAIKRFSLFEVTPSVAAPAIVSMLADPLFITNSEGKITIVNQVATTLLRLELKDLVGEPLARFLPIAADLIEEIKKLPAEKTAIVSGEEAVLKTNEDKEIAVSLTVGVVRDEGRSPVGLAVICHDISGLKEQLWAVKKQAEDLENTKRAMTNLLEDARELEEQLKKEKASVEAKVEERTKELQKEQTALEEAKKQVETGYVEIQREKAKLLSSINNLPVGFILVDPKNDILAINEKTKEIFGPVSKLEEIEKRLAESFDLHQIITKSQLYGSAQSFDEVAFEDKFLRIILTPIIMPHDHRELIGTVILIEDITERKLLERSKDEFFAVAAHDLRTPLTAIRGNASMILQYFSDKLKDPSLKEMIDDIHVSSVRLIGLVNDYLDVARLEQGKIEFTKEAFDLASLVQEAVDQLETNATAKGLYLRLEKSKEELPMVLADKARVSQVVFNLLGNGIKFTSKGGVSLALTRDGGFIRVAENNTGEAIPKEKQKFLFKKFEQLGSGHLTRDATTGSGLGLYISKLLVEGMGGKIYLESSEEGKGTTFVFTLPIAKEA